ncbi:hypothetical protein [Paraliomyxa miuraensis]|uniref:hypothetical protein n=1 Tax=Paraliomyxa miuraensis TaxID=376150 RepID=UPI00224DF08A|nr:hypothetical protein [Paraliomyxa miuraensis]MCX4246319.1 hypothetical protein [Paraliomyxa miuraensis]
MSTPQATETEPTTGSLPPPELLAAIETIRERIPTVTEFSDLFEVFDEQVVRSPALWSSSERRRHDVLHAIVHQVAPQLRPGFVPLFDSFFEIRGTDFWHGAVTGSNGLACVFYDERSRMGMMAMCNPFDGTGMTHFVRITRVLTTALDGDEARLPN